MNADEKVIRIARTIRDNRGVAGLRASAVAHLTGLNVSTVRWHLAKLREAGHVLPLGSERCYNYVLSASGEALAARRISREAPPAPPARPARQRPVRPSPARTPEKAPESPQERSEPAAPSREPSLRDRVLTALAEALGLHELGARTGAGRRELIPELEALAASGTITKERRGGRAIWRAA